MVNQSQTQRQIWMAVLAQASPKQLEFRWQQLQEVGLLPTYSMLRSPEIGLTMVRGRAGGTGQPFNLGEMTLTRCVVQLEQTTDSDAMSEAIAGFGYVAGRSQRHAELAAVCDALLQHPDWHEPVQAQVIQPLRAIAKEQRETEAAQVEATRVNFFTMLRGE